MVSAKATLETISIRDLRGRLDYAKARLTHEKADILSIFPLDSDFSYEEYAFAYLRAERIGMHAINRKLASIAWLPMHLDPSSEKVGNARGAIKRWISTEQKSKAALHHNAGVPQPSSDIFGNDFMHALTRAGMGHGWDTPHFHKLSARVAALFRDLSCLIGIVYYCTWLSENGVHDVPLRDPDDLTHTAQDIATYLQSSSLQQKLRREEAKQEAARGEKETDQDTHHEEAMEEGTIETAPASNDQPKTFSNGATQRALGKAGRTHLKLVSSRGEGELSSPTNS